MNDRQQRRAATLKAAGKLSLYIHLAIYVAVNALLVVINLTASPGYHWFWWPILGWGIGLALHALLLLLIPKLASYWQRMVDKEMSR